ELELLERDLARQLPRTGALAAVPFEVEHRRQRLGIGRHGALEPGGLLVCRPAPEHEVVGAAAHAGALRAIPILEEALVDVVATLGRLDEGELRAGGPDRGPVDLA